MISNECICKYFETPKGHAGDKPQGADWHCDVHGTQYRDYAETIGVDARTVIPDNTAERQAISHILQQPAQKIDARTFIPNTTSINLPEHLVELISTLIKEAEERGQDNAIHQRDDAADSHWFELGRAQGRKEAVEGLKYGVGDRVHKPQGYRFVGTVVAAYKNLSGEARYVVENADGLQHIFNEGQLTHHE